MSSPKTFPIKETISEIRKLMKSVNPMIAKRLQALLIFKKHESTGIAKRIVAKELGKDQNSIQTWRTMYIEGGIDKLMDHSMIGYKPSSITKEQEEAIREQMNNPERLKPSPIQEEKVKMGELGKKSGKGYYNYAPSP